MDLILLILITTFIVAIISVVLVLNLIQNHKSSKVKKQLDELEIEKNDEKVKVTTYGYGHGVGMSQYGANEMAKQGYSYIQILKHYYTGVVIK